MRHAWLLGSLALLTACGGNVFAQAELDIQTARLTAEAPRFEQRFQLSVHPKKGEKVEFGPVSGWCRMEALRWQAPEGETAAAPPWFRFRLVDERDGSIQEETVVLLGAETAPATYDHGIFSACDKDIRSCEGTFRLELERQVPPAGGVVEVDWKMSTEALVSEYEDDELDVRLTLLEP
ncbi:hypothetical protein [Pyxidicoccus xibeiensis]|uniref:hypothetical protein n=1 Tax=Pyxidicoccus xibeiensis TaxID=2906759 RepID=UPI0020A7587E|nr:hypothetical protein [Pyxidicoccus xibeiensis]MCP3136453.1 hypothetical protein [Pyxidicoccus xibeiensis]